MKLFDEELAKLASLLMTYSEVYPDEGAEQLREKVLQHFTDQTGTKDIKPYIFNQRCAGRKPSISEEQKQAIIDSRKSGMTFDAIAKQFDISVGSVHKILNPSAYK